MNQEYPCKAFVDGKLVEVVACYEVDFPKALVYGIFTADDLDTDVTEKIHPDEFDRIYMEVCTKMIADTHEAAEAVGER